MAFRRSLSIRAKIFNHNRYAPSFTYIHNHHNDTEDSNKPLNDQLNPHGSFQNRNFSSTRGFSPIFRDPGVSNLGNSLLNGSFLLRRMSSAIGDGTGKMDYMTDVAGVLSDGSVDVVTQQAPVLSEVAVAAADSYFPVAALQYVIDGIHSYTGLPWWGSIVATTLLIRGLAVPLMINQLKATSKLTLMRPKLEEIKQQMQDRGMSPTAVTEGQQKMAEVFKEYGVTPWTPLKGLLIQGPVFVSFFLGIQNMVEKVPSFKEGGAFWFVDLTIPDSFYIFPVLTALTFWITVECNAQDGLEGNPTTESIKANQNATEDHFREMHYANWSGADCIFSSQRAADFVHKTSKEITTPELLSHFKATIVQVKSLHNRFDETHKVVLGLSNDIALKELSLKKDRAQFITMQKDQTEIKQRLTVVESNQTVMSSQLTSIAASLELLTSVFLPDDVKKGEKIPKDKCKRTPTLRLRDDSHDGGSRETEKLSKYSQKQGRLRSNSD